MRRKIPLILLGCLVGVPAGADDAGPATEAIADASAILRDAGVEGCFVLHDLGRELTTIVGPELASEPFLPASTFKIPNALVALETGVAPDEHFTLEWDGVRRDLVESWNRDHDLRSAMRDSVVWYFQELARRVGEERFRRYLALFDYGNQNISAGVDTFWLAPDSLQITPLEQVAFLTRLVRGELPVDPRSTAIVRSIVPSAAHGGLALRAKTGLGEQAGRRVGWLVGWVEDPGGKASHAFASLVLAPAEGGWRDGPIFKARREVPLRMLVHFGIVDEAMGQPK